MILKQVAQLSYVVDFLFIPPKTLPFTSEQRTSPRWTPKSIGYRFNMYQTWIWNFQITRLYHWTPPIYNQVHQPKYLHQSVVYLSRNPDWLLARTRKRNANSRGTPRIWYNRPTSIAPKYWVCGGRREASTMINVNSTRRPPSSKAHDPTILIPATVWPPLS